MRNPLQILLLILAGEAIFLLPFVLARVFRPTFLAVFELSNTQLGNCYSLYGMVALLSYLLGGTVADRFPPRKLMALALFLTALGGGYMYTHPSFEALRLLYAYWGFTTIFLFWSAMIKATRSWGGQAHQGKAFGFLEGGRGFFAASIGTLSVVIFTWAIPSEIDIISLAEKQETFQWVILVASVFCAAIGLLLLFSFQDTKEEALGDANGLGSWKDIKKAFSNASVRYLMLIVLSAYVGYKITDVFSLYASEIMLFDEVDAAKVGSYQMYLRPFICVFVGFFADRTNNVIVLCYAFACMLLGALYICYRLGGHSSYRVVCSHPANNRFRNLCAACRLFCDNGRGEDSFCDYWNGSGVNLLGWIYTRYLCWTYNRLFLGWLAWYMGTPTTFYVFSCFFLIWTLRFLSFLENRTKIKLFRS